MNRFQSYMATTALFALATILVSFSANAGLCAKCAGKMFVMNVGKCAVCGKATSSGAFNLCQACSAAKNQCEACGASLSAPCPATVPVAVSEQETKPVVPPGTEVKPATEITPVTPAEAVPVEKKAPVEEIKPVTPPVAVQAMKKKPVVPLGMKVKPAAAAPAAPAGK